MHPYLFENSHQKNSSYTGLNIFFSNIAFHVFENKCKIILEKKALNGFSMLRYRNAL